MGRVGERTKMEEMHAYKQVSTHAAPVVLSAYWYAPL